MNSRKTLRKQLVWRGCAGRVRAAVWEFERVCVFNAGSEHAVEGATFVERALVLNLGQQQGVWLSMGDVRSVREVFDRVDAEAWDRSGTPGDSHADLAKRAVASLMNPQADTGEDARLAQYRRVLVSSIRSVCEPLADACTRSNARTPALLALIAEPASGMPAESDTDEAGVSSAEDEQGEAEERQRVIRDVLWKDFEPLRPLCDRRKLPDAVKAAFPVSPLCLTQWVNDSRHGGEDDA